MSIIAGKERYDFRNRFRYENGFYLTSEINRLGKALAQYELFKRITTLPGAVIECGIFKGASFLRLATFRDLLESQVSRKIIGFDTFDKFPDTDYEPDKQRRKEFINTAGEKGISRSELVKVMKTKGFGNFELVVGDITTTVPEYAAKNPQLKIALLHIDTDIYEPTVVILQHLYDRVCKGGIIAFDDYGVFPGETKAVDEFFKDKDVFFEKLPISHIPTFIVKR